MLLKKHKVCRGEIWTRKYIKDDMCMVCKYKNNSCGSSGRLKVCAMVNENGELFDGKYKYAYVV